MRRLALFAWLLLCSALTVAGAYCLTLYVDTLPFNMPYWVDISIRFGFMVFLHDDMPDPDDMSGIALLFYFTCAIVLVGFIVGIAGRIFWRRFLSPHLPHHEPR